MSWALVPVIVLFHERRLLGYRELLCPFRIRSVATIVFQFRVVAGAP
jgi:hypothetical protein